MAIRDQLGLKSGEIIGIQLQGSTAVIQARDWQHDLARLHEKVAVQLRNNRVPPLSDDALDDAINAAASHSAETRLLDGTKR